MARYLSTALLKGLVRSCRPSSAAECFGWREGDFFRSVVENTALSRPAFQQFMNYSSGLGGAPDAHRDSITSHVADDPDTHQDFQPTSKSSGMSLNDIVAQDIKENPVIIYMKGHRDAPRCGFSALAVKVLQQYDVHITSRDILSDLMLKESVKAHTNWPTFPQIFINGEFVGGSDIILSMHQKGELKDLLGDVGQKAGQDDAS